MTYNLYKNGSGDFAYHEYDGSTGRLIANTAISVTPVAATGPVPEPTTWALMLVGLGVTGASLRRRRALPA